MNDHDEQFVDAGLPHGGIPDGLQESWITTLAEYNGGHIIVRSPGDNSSSWHVDEGGSREGLPSGKAIILLSNDDPADDPAASDICRWTSYGLNNYLTTKGPRYRDPKHGQIEHYRSLKLIPRPYATVHWVLMVEDEPPAGFSDYTRSDHVHAEGWYNPFNPSLAAEAASLQMELHAHGGNKAKPEARSNYGYLDGHVETQPFSAVYTEFYDNRFFPEVAQ